MKSNRVISPKNLPHKLPFTGTLVCILSLDKLSVPDWVWGAFGVLAVLVWITAITLLVKAEHVDLLKGKPE